MEGNQLFWRRHKLKEIREVRRGICYRVSNLLEPGEFSAT